MPMWLIPADTVLYKLVIQ